MGASFGGKKLKNGLSGGATFGLGSAIYNCGFFSSTNLNLSRRERTNRLTLRPSASIACDIRFSNRQMPIFIARIPGADSRWPGCVAPLLIGRPLRDVTRRPSGDGGGGGTSGGHTNSGKQSARPLEFPASERRSEYGRWSFLQRFPYSGLFYARPDGGWLPRGRASGLFDG